MVIRVRGHLPGPPQLHAGPSPKVPLTLVLWRTRWSVKWPDPGLTAKDSPKPTSLSCKHTVQCRSFGCHRVGGDGPRACGGDTGLTLSTLQCEDGSPEEWPRPRVTAAAGQRPAQSSPSQGAETCRRSRGRVGPAGPEMCRQQAGQAGPDEWPPGWRLH